MCSVLHRVRLFQEVGLFEHFRHVLDGRIAALKRTSLFDSVSDAAMLGVGTIARSVKYSRGDLILRQGDPAECLFVICKGVCQVRARQLWAWIWGIRLMPFMKKLILLDPALPFPVPRET